MTASFSSVPRFSHQAMGTFFEIFTMGEEEPYARQTAQAAFREIDRLERLFSRFDPASDISRINRLRPGEEMSIGFETFECLSLGDAVRMETGGAFDANARASAKTGPLTGFEIAEESEGYIFRRLAADPASVPFTLDLDLGAIGKGYALDKALNILREWGVENALLHGGTSTALAIGSPDKQQETAGWPVGVGAGWPGAPSRVILSNRALSGSGTEVKGEHILDPRTGLPARRHLAAWASASSAARSDALSTAFFVMTTEEVEDYTRLHPDIGACVVIAYGDVRVFNPALLP